MNSLRGEPRKGYRWTLKFANILLIPFYNMSDFIAIDLNLLQKCCNDLVDVEKR